MMRATNKFFRRTSSAVFYLLILVIIFFIYGTLPNRWYHILIINSGSMSPTIQPGDLIVVTPPPSVLKPGMILTFSVNGSLVTHRLIEFGEYGKFITKGDANTVVDDWNRSHLAVVGQFRARIPYLGRLFSVMDDFNPSVFSGAWFANLETISGELSTSTGWATQEPPQDRDNLRGSLKAFPFYDQGNFGVDLQVCVINNGNSRIQGYLIQNNIQIRNQDVFDNIISEFLDEDGFGPLEIGEEHCQSAHYLLPNGKEGETYRDLVRVVFERVTTNALIGDVLSQEETTPILLELATDFELPVPPITNVTPTPPPTITPIPLITNMPIKTMTSINFATPSPTSTPPPNPTPTSSPEATTATLTPTIVFTEESTPTPTVDELPTQTLTPTTNITFTPTASATNSTALPDPTDTPIRDCVFPVTYWAEYTETWPIAEIELGDLLINQSSAQATLTQDSTNRPGIWLAQELIAAKLNIANGSYANQAIEKVAEADRWFVRQPFGSELSADDRGYAQGLAANLNQFNNGLSGLPICSSWKATSTPTPSVTLVVPTISATPTQTNVSTQTLTPVVVSKTVDVSTTSTAVEQTTPTGSSVISQP